MSKPLFKLCLLFAVAMMVTVSADSSAVHSSEEHESDHGSHESGEHLEAESSHHEEHDDDVSDDHEDHASHEEHDSDEVHESHEEHESSEEHESHESGEEHDSHEGHGHSGHDGKSSDNMLKALGITSLSGCAALLGYCFIFCINRDHGNLIPVSLGFSGGVLVYLTFMNLIPEGVEQFHYALDEESEGMAHFYNVLCIIGGLLLSLSMERAVPHSHGHEHPAVRAEPQIPDMEMNEMSERFASADGQPSPKAKDPLKSDTMLTRAELPRVSYSVAIALILHHLPEGMAVFLSLYHDLDFGILVSVALAIHDFPSGLCIALPTYLATGSLMKPFLLCLLAAFAYFLGGVLGWVIVISATDSFVQSFVGIMFGITSGIMLYVAFVELLPTAITTANRSREVNGTNGHHHHGQSTVYTATIIAIFLGFLVMEIGNIMLAESGGHSH